MTDDIIQIVRTKLRAIDTNHGFPVWEGNIGSMTRDLLLDFQTVERSYKNGQVYFEITDKGLVSLQEAYQNDLPNNK